MNNGCGFRLAHFQWNKMHDTSNGRTSARSQAHIYTQNSKSFIGIVRFSQQYNLFTHWFIILSLSCSRARHCELFKIEIVKMSAKIEHERFSNYVFAMVLNTNFNWNIYEQYGKEREIGFECLAWSIYVALRREIPHPFVPILWNRSASGDMAFAFIVYACSPSGWVFVEISYCWNIRLYIWQITATISACLGNHKRDGKPILFHKQPVHSLSVFVFAGKHQREFRASNTLNTFQLHSLVGLVVVLPWLCRRCYVLGYLFANILEIIPEQLKRGLHFTSDRHSESNVKFSA